jgi:mycothiol synthase
VFCEVIAGTAAAWRSDSEPDAGYLHMLGVMPHHRGKGLGAALVIGTLHYTRSEGLTTQRLLTDDWRLPAIRLYLDLGYDPLWTDCSHPRRWRKIARAIRRPEIIGRARKTAL